MTSSFKENIKTVFINIITCLVLAFVLETGIYLALANPTFIPGFLSKPFQDYYLHNDRQIIQVTECAGYDSALFYLLKPGQCVFENREFSVTNSVNSKGLRDDEKSLESPAIVVLGDSYAMGWGVEQDKCFPQVLERLTRQPVLNAGMSSYGTAREMKLFRRLGLRGVQHIILQYHANDYEENLKYIQNNFKLPIRQEKAYDSLKESINKRQKYFPFKHLYGISKGIAKSLLRQQKRVPLDSDEADAFLKVVKHSLGTSDIDLVVFKIDDFDNLNDRFANAVDSLLKTEDYKGLPVRTVRIADQLEKDDYFVLDDHINATGHYKIARKLMDR